MRTWVKVTLAGVSLVVIGVLALGGTAAYFVFRNLERRGATEADTVRAIEAVRERFPGRPPLVEVIDPQAGNIRLNRLVHPEGRRPTTIHVLAWNADDGELMRTKIPLWLMRFSSLNILSQMGIAPEKFRLTVHDVQQYGPGIVADYRRPGRNLVLIWVE
jgi:hypothetical protein